MLWREAGSFLQGSRLCDICLYYYYFFFTNLKDCTIFPGKHPAIQKPCLGSPTLLYVYHWWNVPEVLELWKVPCLSLGNTGGYRGRRL